MSERRHRPTGPDRDARPWTNTIVIAEGDQPGTYWVGRHHDRGWVFPGGRVNCYETLAVAAAREFEEETGLRVAVMEQLHTFEVIDRRSDYHKIAVVYAGRVTGGQPAASDDLAHLTQMTLDELLANSESADLTVRIAGWLAARG